MSSTQSNQPANASPLSRAVIAQPAAPSRARKTAALNRTRRYLWSLATSAEGSQADTGTPLPPRGMITDPKTLVRLFEDVMGTLYRSLTFLPSAFIEKAEALRQALSPSRPTEHYLHVLQQWVQHREGPPPIPICPICYDELNVKGLPRSLRREGNNNNGRTEAADDIHIDEDGYVTIVNRPDSDGDDDADDADYSEDADFSDDPRKVAVALPCMHIFCQDCIATEDECHLADGAEYICPVCRQSRTATRCGHPVSRVLPRERDEGDITAEELRAGDLPELCAEDDDLEGEDLIWYEESLSSSEPVGPAERESENHDDEDQEEAQRDRYLVRGRELIVEFPRAGLQIIVTIDDEVVIPVHQQEAWHVLP